MAKYLMSKALLALSISFVFAAIWAGLAIHDSSAIVGNTGYETLFLGFVSLSFVSFGWYVTLYVASRSNALSLMFESRLSDVYQSQLRLFSDAVPDGTKVTMEQLNKDDDLFHSVRYLLNYMELISVGIRYGNIAEKTVKEWMAAIFKSLYYRTTLFIAHERERLDSPKIFEHFEHFAKKWEAP